MAFKYRARSEDDVAKRAASGGGDSVSIIKPEYKTWTPAKGNNFIRILPPTWDNPRHYGYDVYVHYQVGPQNGQALCLAKNFNTRCPICDERNAGGRPPLGDKEKDPLMPTRRVVVWMLDMKDADKGPMIWTMAQTLDRDITKICRDPATGETFFIDHPTEGYNISFDKEGEGVQTKYAGVQTARRPSAVQTKFLDYVEEHPLDKCFNVLDYAAIQEMYEGGAAPAPAPARPAREEREPGPARDRAGFGQRRQEEAPPDDDIPPPRSENDYGNNDELGGAAEEKPAQARGGRPTLNPAPEAKEPTPARSSSTAANSLRERLAARQKAGGQ